MRRFEGIAVSGGSRTGRAVHHEAVAFDVERRAVTPDEVPAELVRLSRAVSETERGLEESQQSLVL